jgi:hypothetical protein
MKILDSHLAVLKHVGCFRMTLPEVVGRLMLPECALASATPKDLVNQRKSKGAHVLSRLAQEGLLNHHHHKSNEYPPFPQNVPYFTLSPNGARKAGVPIERSEQAGKRCLSADALAYHLATLWFCCMNSEERHRLEPDELHPLFGKQKAFETVPHCLTVGPRGMRVYRVYPPCTHISGILERVRKQLDSLRDRQALRLWIDERVFGLAILAPEPALCSDVTRALARTGLSNDFLFTVELGPTPATLRNALRMYSEGRL